MEATEKKGFLDVYMTNPIARKLEKKNEIARDGEKTASYQGIGLKTAFLLLMTVAGAALYFILHHQMSMAGPALVQVQENIFDIAIYPEELVALIVSLAAVIIFPLIALAIRPLMPVAGTIYALGQGISIGFITQCLADEYKWLALLAMVLTLSVVGIMLFLYANRIIKVGHKFRKVVTILFLTAAFSSMIFWLLSFIPGVKDVLAGFQAIMANPVVSIISSVVFIVIAALFLLVDFDLIERCVTQGMAKKMEWTAAMALVYTVLYLYFKILDLLITLFSNGSSSD